MKIYFFISLYLIFFVQAKRFLYLEEENDIPKGRKIIAKIHFINCGRADSILIENNNRFGLIDACRPYANATDVVEKAKGKKGEKNPDKSAQALVNYLNYLNVTHLDFILATHSHGDHIGGMPQIAYHFVDSNTKYIHKNYRVSKTDNSAYYNASYNSMKKKGATLIDITDRKYSFFFGVLHLSFVNTNSHKKEEKRSENQNAIGTILTYQNKRIFLASDLEITEDLIYKDQIGKVDLLKLSHHGTGSSSFEFLNITRPNYTVITNHKLPDYAIIPVSFLQQRIGGQAFYYGNIKKSSQSVPESAIRAYITEDLYDISEYTKYHVDVENTGENIKLTQILNGFQNYNGYIFYFDNGIILTGFKQLKANETVEYFYFDQEGIMAIGWKNIFVDDELNVYYFNEYGHMAIGWKVLQKDDYSCEFYFQKDGKMTKDICIEIEGKEECFDQRGCHIE